METTTNAISLKKLTILALGLTLSTISSAHGEAQGNAFISGFTHPIFGFDHLLAMIAVGVLSVQIGARALWIVPMSFVTLMLLGGIIGILGYSMPAVELSIALSVLLLGVAIAFDKKTPLIFTMLFVSFFAVFHGYAHGVEMPSLAEPVQYASGFLLATALLHIVGISIGEGIKLIPKGKQLLRIIGALVASAGVYILAGSVM